MKIIISYIATTLFFLTFSNTTMAQNTNETMSQDTIEYMSPFTPVAKGKAPGMKYKLLSESNGVKEFVLVFAKGDEVLSGISDFASQQHVTAAHFTAIGALKQATTAWFDVNRKSYKLNHVKQQLELISLIGDIALHEGKPAVHVHYSVGLSDGSMQGGHLVEAITFPTVELFMTVYATPLQKKLDKETDLVLIHPEIQ
jgi:predicted DNA-binding protein with PD1-like motif